MTKNPNLRKRLFANAIHKEIFFLVFGAAIIPTIIVSVSLYHFIFYVTAEQIGIPETIAYHIVPAANKVTEMLFLVIPTVIIFILVIAFRISHSIVGPYDRIIREMNENLSGQRRGPIFLRKNDRFWPLVCAINDIIHKMENP
jgi:sensor histidine kinase YesM